MHLKRFLLVLLAITGLGSTPCFADFVVTNTDDSGTGSLRQALASAATAPGADTITFAPALSGQTITLASQILVDQAGAVTVDASNLAEGMTIDAGADTFRIFQVNGGGAELTVLTLRCLTLINGRDVGGGGAIYNSPTSSIVLDRCTLSGNAGTANGAAGGAIYNLGGAVLNQCTLSGNSAPGVGVAGGAILNTNFVRLTHCTLSNNSTDGAGGGICNFGRVVLNRSIVSGNSAGAGPNLFNDPANGEVTFEGTSIMPDSLPGTVNNPTGQDTRDPLLGTFAAHGGPTKTYALQTTSPAINAGTGSTITTDQRGVGIFGSAADLGPFEAAPVIVVEQQPANAVLADGGSVNFGTVNRPGSNVITFTVRNTGVLDLTGLATPSLDGGTNFAAGAPGLVTLMPGESTTFTVTFTPTAVGHTRTDTLHLASNAPGAAASFDLTLNGTSNTVPEAPDASFLVVAGVANPITIPYAVTDADGDTVSFAELNLGAAPVTSSSLTPPNVTITPAGGFIGTTSITYKVNDGFTGSATGTITLNVRPLNPVNTPFLAAGGTAPDAAPGAGVFPDLPADATLASFNPPAIDDDGNIAFVAKWTGTVSGKPAKGTGVFVNDDCLGLLGTTYKSFADPLIDDGLVACLATLAGAPKATASVVLSNVGTGTQLEVIARAGDVAPIADGTQPTDGAKYKTFKAVAIHDNYVAIFAQLAGGLGEKKATAASDLGLWIKDHTQTVRLVLREGEETNVGLTSGTRVVKTIVSFVSGAGSPGQGRGWLSHPYGATALALVTFTDKSQAIVWAAGGGGLSLFSQTGATGATMGPDITDAAFATFGLPATNNNSYATFLASMKVGVGGVTKADAKGVFISDGNGAYKTLARVNTDAGVNSGAKFSVLKDPVLASDNGVAFPATLKGGTAKGLATTTLWWQASGGDPILFAQAGPVNGGVVTDLPAGAQWKAFPSLAIAANRGPIFTGTLVPGKGGVTASTASGVWATDYQGTIRTLFRTGVKDQIVADKTLKSFTVLKATVGSEGVTRSFNVTQKVMWLATFTDKTQAIVTTEVP